MSTRIVPIEQKHADGFHACVDAVAREKRFLIFQEAPPVESTRAFVRENLESGQVHFVVLDGERVVGWCDIRKTKLPSVAHVGTVGIGLLPEFRGKGIGKALLAAAIRAAFASGVERIELMVYASNLEALALYRTLGFVEEGRMARRARIDGAYLDMICMALFKRDG
jgi:ribosomal protein S18 acetylase RimI-like enzyme